MEINKITWYVIFLGKLFQNSRATYITIYLRLFVWVIICPTWAVHSGKIKLLYDLLCFLQARFFCLRFTNLLKWHFVLFIFCPEGVISGSFLRTNTGFKNYIPQVITSLHLKSATKMKNFLKLLFLWLQNTFSWHLDLLSTGILISSQKKVWEYFVWSILLLAKPNNEYETLETVIK